MQCDDLYAIIEQEKKSERLRDSSVFPEYIITPMIVSWHALMGINVNRKDKDNIFDHYGNLK